MRGSARGVALALAAMALGAAGCSKHELPRPALVAAPRDALFEVPYPPPPGRVESVPPRPRPDAVWIDGQWTWEARRWQWQRGGWVVAPAGARFAPWNTVRAADGRLFFSPPAWYTANGTEVPAPPLVAPAQRPGRTAVR